MKSAEELQIANWLFLNGVQYEYERDYPFDTGSVQYRRYRPDFFLPKYNVYLEHFGVDRDGQPAPWIDAASYATSMAWKREIHQANGTTLIETYSYERKEGTLVGALEERLRAVGVEFQPLDGTRVKQVITQQGHSERFARLLGTFLCLAKGSRLTIPDLETAAKQTEDHARTASFIRVFRHVQARYEAELLEAGEIDFEDMINEAAEAVECGRFRSEFSYVLVDEFQDLSRGRARLLKALLGQLEDSRLFGVGDNWQSIYRFTGSDVSVMTCFANEFGFCHQAHLTQTHRFKQELLEATSRFIQANPGQLKKRLVSGERLRRQAIEVHTQRHGEQSEGLLDRVLSHLTKGLPREHRGDVLILARYKHVLTDGGALHTLHKRHPRLDMRALTIHKAKGLEADYCVVLDVQAGRLGIPSEIVDDPVLDTVLPPAEPFENAEERRVFYVALTRTRRRAFLLAPSALVRESRFVQELTEAGYREWVRCDRPADELGLRCPECDDGRFTEKSGEKGPFWGCSNYPLCEASAVAKCPACDKKSLVRQSLDFKCGDLACDYSSEVCPACGVGALILKKGTFGPFLGCTEYRRQGASCSYTRRQV